MGLLDYSKSNPWVGDGLFALSQMLMAQGSGNPQAANQIPGLLADRQRYRHDDQRQAKQDQRQDQLFQMQMEENSRRANTEAAQRKAAMGLLGGPAPANGMSQAQFGGAPTQQGLLGDFQPPVQNYIKTLIDAGDYGSAIDIYGKLATEKPDKEDIKDNYMNVGGSLIDLRDPSKPIYVDPKEPKAPRDNWEPYKDPVTGMTGQRNTATGKVDWDPGQTGGIQVDTNGDGTPDIVVGGKGMKPPTESQAKAANQYTLLNGALDDLEKTVGEGDVNPWASAAADSLAEQGPLSGVVGQEFILSPKDKQMQASRAAALESLANSITGAAFTEEQKRNFTNMLPQATDDAETTKFKMKRMRDYLSQLQSNAGTALKPSGAGRLKYNPETGDFE
jgi:hypothetical protein